KDLFPLWEHNWREHRFSLRPLWNRRERQGTRVSEKFRHERDRIPNTVHSVHEKQRGRNLQRARLLRRLAGQGRCTRSRRHHLLRRPRRLGVDNYWKRKGPGKDRRPDIQITLRIHIRL